jgi:hypothetical protein
LTISKHILGSTQRWISALSGSVWKYTSMWACGSCGYHMIWKAYVLDSDPPSSQRQEAGRILSQQQNQCFVPIQASVVRLDPGQGGRDLWLCGHQSLCCLKFSVASHQILSLSSIISHCHLPSKLCGRMPQVSLSWVLFSGPQIISMSNNRTFLKIVPFYCPLR